ncbi:hypothetical protein NQ315_000817 [Exocentrus adspersus]|uniref:TIL domain-containing protein n=1 Tax=Exocentrus adspersus TaxID=1586481 RepID=A0AAV8WEJ0_9CUCU|nr:hypothetical protein NQ315_000817 [Exocentrus adspersus]
MILLSCNIRSFGKHLEIQHEDFYYAVVFCLLFFSIILSDGQADVSCDDPNSVQNGCGSACPPTCQQKQRGCIQVCVGGCFCRENYILDEETNKCVEEQSC